MLVRTSTDGRRSTRCSWSARPRCARSATAASTSSSCWPTGPAPVTAMIWDGVAAVAALVPRRRRRCASSGATARIRATARRSPSARCAARAEGTFDPTDLLDGPPRAADQMEAELRELHRHGARPAPAPSCSTGSSARARATWARSATRRRRSSTTRPTATGCSSTRSRSPRPCTRSARRSRASTTTSRSPARCCTTSASSRPTPPTACASR